MALRTIRMMGDDILTKKCREVKTLTPRLRQLIDDMLETMRDADGIGLAAPQVGVLRRIVVIDISDVAGEEDIGENAPTPLSFVMVNPVLLEAEGEQTGDEGCLSLPGKVGRVTRPNHIKVRYFDADMAQQEIEAEQLLARAVCHELDHLDGHVYLEKVEGEIRDVRREDEEEEEEK